MELILYVIFVFTLLLIIFSINEYYETCLIKSCKPKFELIPANGTTPSSCKECVVLNADTYEPNTCKISKCIGDYKPNADNSACEKCSTPNVLTYKSDGSCDVLTCSPGYKIDPLNSKLCTICTNTDKVYTYDTTGTCLIK